MSLKVICGEPKWVFASFLFCSSNKQDTSWSFVPVLPLAGLGESWVGGWSSSTNPILLSTYFPLANYVIRSLEESIAPSVEYKNDCWNQKLLNQFLCVWSSPFVLLNLHHLETQFNPFDEIPIRSLLSNSTLTSSNFRVKTSTSLVANFCLKKMKKRIQ